MPRTQTRRRSRSQTTGLSISRLLAMMMHPVRKWFLESVCGQFPPIRFAFAYGSAVFQQKGRAKGKMLDMVFAVDDAASWHAENLRCNNSHYSFMRVLGPRTIAQVQHLSAGVYYNTLLHIDSQLVKYGVITVEDLCKDLIDWKWLYTSGRLHKPVIILTPLNSTEELRITEALQYNLRCAALCAVLSQVEPEFTYKELFTAIANLSYRGDFRSVFGEDKQKVDNIVSGNLTEFRTLYQPHLQELVETTTCGQMRKLPGVTMDKFQDQLPAGLRRYIQQGTSIQNATKAIVLRSSIQQSIKGLLTAGLKKSVVYSLDKIQKMVKSVK